IGNENQHSMVEAEFRIMFSRDERLLEGGDFRHFYVLKLHFDRLTVFPAALTLRHTIDEKSPLFGATPESLQSTPVLFLFFLWSESIPSLLPPSKRKRTTVGAISASANVLSKFIPSTAADDSLSTTPDFTNPRGRGGFPSPARVVFFFS